MGFWFNQASQTELQASAKIRSNLHICRHQNVPTEMEKIWQEWNKIVSNC